MKRSTYILVLIFSLVLDSCSLFESSHQDAEEDPQFETLIKVPDGQWVRFIFDADEPVTTVIQSKSDETDFVEEYPTDDPFPYVDYSRHAVVGVLAGQKPNTSYSITIDSISVLPSTTKFYATERGSAFGGRALTYPNHFVLVPPEILLGRNVNFAFARFCFLSPCTWEMK